MTLPQVGISAARERAQQVERGGCLGIGADHALRIVAARLGVEFDPVDVIAEVARQGDRTLGLRIRAARLGELARHAANLHHRPLAGESHDDRHLQQHAERVADVVRVELGKAFRAVPALQQETVAVGNGGQIGLQRTRFARKHQRGVVRKSRLGLRQRGGVLVSRQVPRFVRLPGFRGPVACHCLFVDRCGN